MSDITKTIPEPPYCTKFTIFQSDRPTLPLPPSKKMKMTGLIGFIRYAQSLNVLPSPFAANLSMGPPAEFVCFGLRSFRRIRGSIGPGPTITHSTIHGVKVVWPRRCRRWIRSRLDLRVRRLLPFSFLLWGSSPDDSGLFECLDLPCGGRFPSGVSGPG